MKPQKLDKKIEQLEPQVRARLAALPAEFTKQLKTALFGAEMMFRLQGGCPPLMQILTADSGEFTSPVPDSVQGYAEIRAHMAALLASKPGVTAVYFSFTSTPMGAGSKDGRSTLNCFFATPECLHQMRADITANGCLGEWTLTKHARAGDG
jgi:hypothetical protein